VTDDADHDVIIVGAGVAGSRLLAHLLRSSWRTRRILVVERELARPRDHVLAFWFDAPTALDPLVGHRWTTLRVADDAGEVVAPLREHVYAATNRRALVDAAVADASTCPNVQVVRGEVEAIVDGADAAAVRVGERWYRGAWVFDSRRPAPAPATVRLVQRFTGWTVEAAALRLDPQAATLFDFRTAQGGGLGFVYVLPLAPGRALVEHVFMGHEDAAGPDPELALRTYLAAHLRLPEGYRVAAHERGSSTLADDRRPTRIGRRIRAIGVRGGRLKPSSGYALMRIERDSAAIVRSLVERGDPFHGARERRLYRWLDAIFLWALAREPERAPAIFAALLRRPDPTLRLLDERAGLFDLVTLLVALPTWMFVRAAFAWMSSSRRVDGSRRAADAAEHAPGERAGGEGDRGEDEKRSDLEPPLDRPRRQQHRADRRAHRHALDREHRGEQVPDRSRPPERDPGEHRERDDDAEIERLHGQRRHPQQPGPREVPREPGVDPLRPHDDQQTADEEAEDRHGAAREA
jgi:lycopene beta-cyclase